MKKNDLSTYAYLLLSDPRVLCALQFLLVMSFLFFSDISWANESSDLLAGSDVKLKATSKGTARTVVIIVDAFVNIALYIKTKNLLQLFGGFIVVLIFFEILFKIAVIA